MLLQTTQTNNQTVITVLQFTKSCRLALAGGDLCKIYTLIESHGMGGLRETRETRRLQLN